MSNYTKTTDFEAKDSLPSGDSGKIIRGSEFETEFDNIAIAIASKSDANNPTFTGTVTIDGLTVNGNTVLGNAATDTVTVTADIASNLLPSADDTYNLGAVGAEWNDLFIDGTANIDSLVADTADINGGTVDGVTIGGSSAGAITGTTITGTSFVTSGDMTFGDNDKAIFGAGSDLQIYHDGGNSRILENGTGFLAVGTNGTDIRLTGNSFTEFMAKFEQDGPVTLYHNNAEKLATTSTGIDVTGTVTADGLTVQEAVAGGSVIGLIKNTDNTSDSKAVLELQTNNGTWDLSANRSGYLDIVNPQNTLSARFSSGNPGDFYLYEDTGTTAKFVWDASTERLGLGTTSPSYPLAVYGSNTGSEIVASFGSPNGVGDYTAIGLSGFIAGNDATKAGIALKRVDTFGTGELHFLNNNTLDDSDMTLSDSKMMIDTSGNVGIGTTPATNTRLHVVDSISTYLKLERTGATAGVLLIGAESGVNTIYSRDSSTGAAPLKFVSGTSEAMRIDASGALLLNPNNPGRGLKITTSTSLAVGDTTTYDTIGAGYGTHIFKTDGAERMRIDSSGNVLVGTASAVVANSSSNVGTAIGAGLIESARAGVVAQFNRHTSDGEIIDFQRAGTTVGTISAASTNIIYGNDTRGLKIEDTLIIPRDIDDTTADNQMDLGSSTSRFKDLYLSGGAYLGGSVAANKLDDYEEGTWTPTYTPQTGSFTTMSLSAVTANYTKIGDTVIATCYVRTSAVDVTGASGALYLGGLPFTINGYYQISIGNTFGWAGSHPDGGFGFTGNDYVALRYRASSTADSADVDVSDLTTGTTPNKNQVMMTFIYKTSA